MSDKCKNLTNELCEANCLLDQTTSQLLDMKKRLEEQIKLHDLISHQIESVGLKYDIKQVTLDPIDGQPYG